MAYNESSSDDDEDLNVPLSQLAKRSRIGESDSLICDIEPPRLARSSPVATTAGKV